MPDIQYLLLLDTERDNIYRCNISYLIYPFNIFRERCIINSIEQFYTKTLTGCPSRYNIYRFIQGKKLK